MTLRGEPRGPLPREEEAAPTTGESPVAALMMSLLLSLVRPRASPLLRSLLPPLLWL